MPSVRQKGKLFLKDDCPSLALNYLMTVWNVIPHREYSYITELVCPCISKYVIFIINVIFKIK